MGSTGTKKEEYRIRTEEITGTPLIFADAVIRPATAENSEMVDIDGYSNKKTLNGAIRDLAKAVAKYNKIEANALLDMIKTGELQQYTPDMYTDKSNIGYLLDWEEVGSATRLNEETDEVEYADGRWYLHVRFVNS